MGNTKWCVGSSRREGGHGGEPYPSSGLRDGDWAIPVGESRPEVGSEELAAQLGHAEQSNPGTIPEEVLVGCWVVSCPHHSPEGLTGDGICLLHAPCSPGCLLSEESHSERRHQVLSVWCWGYMVN